MNWDFLTWNTLGEFLRIFSIYGCASLTSTYLHEWFLELDRFRITLLCSMENNIFIFEQTIPLNHHATDLIVSIVNYNRKTQKALTKVNKQCNEHLVVTIHFKRITGNFVHTRKKIIKYILCHSHNLHN